MEKEKVFGKYDERTLESARQYYGCIGMGLSGCWQQDKCPIALGYEIKNSDDMDDDTMNIDEISNHCTAIAYCDGFQSLLDTIKNN